MIVVGAIGLLPLVVIPLLKREEFTWARRAPPPRAKPPHEAQPTMNTLARRCGWRWCASSSATNASSPSCWPWSWSAASPRLGLAPLRPLPLRYLLARHVVRGVQGVHPGAGHREPPRDGPHLHGRARGGSSWSSRSCTSPAVPTASSTSSSSRWWRSTRTTLAAGSGSSWPWWRGSSHAAAAALAPPWVGWTPVIILMGLVGLPAFALGHVAERERRARAEVERLNAEVTGTLTRLQAAQQELVVAERMATVGRLVKVARGAQPHRRHRAERRDAGRHRGRAPGTRDGRGREPLTAIREQVTALDALTEEYLAFARFPRPQFEEDSVNEMVAAVAEFVRPLATRQGISVRSRQTRPCRPWPSTARCCARPCSISSRTETEALSQGGCSRDHTVPRRHRGDLGERHRSGHPARVASGCSSSSSPPSRRAPDSGSPSPARSWRSTAAASAGAASSARAPLHHLASDQEGRACLIPRCCWSPTTIRRSARARAHLTREGYQVALAPDGHAALDRLRAGGVDLVLST